MKYMTPGKAAYSKFVELTSLPQEEPLCSWEKLSSVGREAWQEIANSAIRSNVCGIDGEPCVPPRFTEIFTDIKKVEAQ